MICSSPLYRLPISSRSLKTLGFIINGDSFCGRRPHKGAYFFKRQDLYSIPMEVRSNLQPIACGSCISCRVNAAKRWSDRLQLESRLYKNNLFLTLTYDDDHLPYCGAVHPSTGEFEPYTLSKRDLQLFFKRLRHYADGLRYFACGEYGEKSTHRPHYHVILLNCPDSFYNDFVFYKKNGNGDILYKSAFFDSVWKNGFVTVGDVTPLSISYTAQYCLKKVSRSYQDLENFQYPFCVMSRRPGIGSPYFDLHKDSIMSTGSVILQKDDKFVNSPCPSYFLYLIKNKPMRALRYSKDHFLPGVVDVERQSTAAFKELSARRSSFASDADSLRSMDSRLLPGSTSFNGSALQAADRLRDKLTSTRKRYTLKYATF